MTQGINSSFARGSSLKRQFSRHRQNIPMRNSSLSTVTHIRPIRMMLKTDRIPSVSYLPNKKQALPQDLPQRSSCRKVVSALSAVWKFLPFRNSTGVGSRVLCMQTRTSVPKLNCTGKTLYIRERSATSRQVSRLQPPCLTVALPVSMLQQAASASA